MSYVEPDADRPRNVVRSLISALVRAPLPHPETPGRDVIVSPPGERLDRMRMGTTKGKAVVVGVVELISVSREPRRNVPSQRVCSQTRFGTKYESTGSPTSGTSCLTRAHSRLTRSPNCVSSLDPSVGKDEAPFWLHALVCLKRTHSKRQLRGALVQWQQQFTQRRDPMQLGDWAAARALVHMTAPLLLTRGNVRRAGPQQDTRALRSHSHPWRDRDQRALRARRSVETPIAECDLGRDELPAGAFRSSCDPTRSVAVRPDARSRQRSLHQAEKTRPRGVR